MFKSCLSIVISNTVHKYFSTCSVCIRPEYRAKSMLPESSVIVASTVVAKSHYFANYVHYTVGLFIS